MDPQRIVADGYDRIARRYAEWGAGGDEVRAWFPDEVLQRLRAGAAVLELGCGSATAAATLADGRSYTGVDLSAGQLAMARERLPDLMFLQGDVTTIPFADASIDAVVALWVFTHVPRAEQGPTFARIFRWLRPGGRLMLTLGAGDTLDEVQED